MGHPGIIVRISIAGAIIMQADSMVIHWQAKAAGTMHGEWQEMLRTTDGLLIEAQPVMLEEWPDTEE